jgi:hypothetical protein
MANKGLQEREKKSTKFDKMGMTDEELAKKQEELFAASKARFEQSNRPAGERSYDVE